VMARGGDDVGDDVARAFERLVARRVAREPVSRIVGAREFYGRLFRVTADVLDPRPDTEILVEAVLARMPQDAALRMLDLGTGSGAIILSLLAERPMATGVAVDVSPAALAVAAQNAECLGVAARFAAIEGAWFQNVSGVFDVIVSNPPYIEAGDIPRLTQDVRDYDPHLALDGGADGLVCYRAIAQGAAAFLAPGGVLAVEIGAGQARDVEAIFNQNGFFLEKAHEDLGGHLRCLIFNRNSKRP
jgi:release factor glutamine methyltransferase